MSKFVNPRHVIDLMRDKKPRSASEIKIALEKEGQEVNGLQLCLRILKEQGSLVRENGKYVFVVIGECPYCGKQVEQGDPRKAKDDKGRYWHMPCMIKLASRWYGNDEAVDESETESPKTYCDRLIRDGKVEVPSWEIAEAVVRQAENAGYTARPYPLMTDDDGILVELIELKPRSEKKKGHDSCYDCKHFRIEKRNFDVYFYCDKHNERIGQIVPGNHRDEYPTPPIGYSRWSDEQGGWQNICFEEKRKRKRKNA